jgi:hypothetical protein
MATYRLEITMEATGSEGHKYIKRSFPIPYGKLDLSKYGYPYSKYAVEITHHEAYRDGGNDTIKAISLLFDGETVKVPLHSFVTVKKEYTDVVVDPYLMVPKTIGNGEIYATFYLYIE